MSKKENFIALNDKLHSMKTEMESMKSKLESLEIDPYDYEEQYCDMLDENGPVNIAGLEYSASYVLREIDPTAYRCGLIDYADSIDITETDEYKELEEQIEELECEIDELEVELEEDDN